MSRSGFARSAGNDGYISVDAMTVAVQPPDVVMVHEPARVYSAVPSESEVTAAVAAADAARAALAKLDTDLTEMEKKVGAASKGLTSASSDTAINASEAAARRLAMAKTEREAAAERHGPTFAAEERALAFGRYDKAIETLVGPAALVPAAEATFTNMLLRHRAELVAAVDALADAVRRHNLQRGKANTHARLIGRPEIEERAVPAILQATSALLSDPNGRRPENDGVSSIDSVVLSTQNWKNPVLVHLTHTPVSPEIVR